MVDGLAVTARKGGKQRQAYRTIPSHSLLLFTINPKGKISNEL
jgi:hypothetical protein